MKELTFENVKKREYDLVHTVDKEVGERYEELTSFRQGRDFNKEVREYVESFVSRFGSYLTAENKINLNERLVSYNKLIVQLWSNILKGTTIPSVMISGGANYPVRKKEKELERLHRLESELYSKTGTHAKFIGNTEKMFDPVLIEQREKTTEKRKELADERGWQSFNNDLEHEELAAYGIDLEGSRVYIETHGKPSDEVRTLLKKAALRWSPKNQRWQRILTNNAISSLVFNVFKPLELDVNTENFTVND